LTKIYTQTNIIKSMSSIKKAVFVVAGFGTRFLPATKAQPKEMLPVVDKPIIQYLVEEAVDAGIENIVFVTGRGKNSIENHFDKSYELEDMLEKKGKSARLEEVIKISKLANFAYVRQPIQNGDGDALLCAKPFIDNDEAVLVIYPDYLMPYGSNTIKNLIATYHEYQRPVIATDYVPDDKVHLYGVLDFEETGRDHTVRVKKFVEKPKQDQAPSNLINNGYFIATPRILEVLEKVSSTVGDGEIRVADAFTAMVADGEEVYAIKPAYNQPIGYDCGTPVGFLKATVDFALQREDLKAEFIEFLKKRVAEMG
jgi:UTP--glucose-1-phosphate uridylyltransferase